MKKIIALTLLVSALVPSMAMARGGGFGGARSSGFRSSGFRSSGSSFSSSRVRSYSNTTHVTNIHTGGYGGGFGSSFFGSYLGASLASHPYVAPVVVPAVTPTTAVVDTTGIVAASPAVIAPAVVPMCGWILHYRCTWWNSFYYW